MTDLTDDVKEIAEDTAKIVITPVKVTITKIKDIVEYIFLGIGKMVDCKSQNTKNEQQKITSEQLTAQWKKGELPADKDYYIKLKSGLILIDYYCQLYDNCHFPIDIGFDSIPEDDIVEILAPVPSYEEYLSLTYAKEEDERIIAEYEAENAQLKELLKECQVLLKYLPIDDYDNKGLILDEKIDEALR